MSRRNIFIGIAVGAAILIAAVWFFFIRSDAPPPASLEDAIESVTDDTQDPATTEPTETTAPAETTTAAPVADGLDGEWSINQANSFAGYRIGEELASIGTIEAVGRTSEVEGSLTFSGTEVTELTVTVDMTTLQSDRSQRDGALRTRGLETDMFPTATFTLSEPIDLGSVPEEGATFAGTAVGDLTLHGVTNAISMDVEGSLVEGTVVVVGSSEVTLADYDIEGPTGFSVLTIEEVGTLELQLAFLNG